MKLLKETLEIVIIMEFVSEEDNVGHVQVKILKVTFSRSDEFTRISEKGSFATIHDHENQINYLINLSKLLETICKTPPDQQAKVIAETPANDRQAENCEG